MKRRHASHVPILNISSVHVFRRRVLAVGLQGMGGKGGEMVGAEFDGHIGKQLESNAALLVRSGFRRKENILLLFDFDPF